IPVVKTPYISSIAAASPDWIRFTRRDQDCPAVGAPACTGDSESDSCAFIMSLQPRRVLCCQASALWDHLASAEMRWQQRSVGGREMPLWEYSFGDLSCENTTRIVRTINTPKKRVFRHNSCGRRALQHVGASLPMKKCDQNSFRLLFAKILPRDRNLARSRAPAH